MIKSFQKFTEDTEKDKSMYRLSGFEINKTLMFNKILFNIQKIVDYFQMSIEENITVAPERRV